MNDQDIEDLLKRYTTGQVTAEEEARIHQWYQLQALSESLPETDRDLSAVKKQIWRKINRRPAFPIFRYAAAALILVSLSVGALLYLNRSKPAIVQVATTKDITPGSSKAILTLGNGRQIILTGAKNGTLAKENHTLIHKTKDGQIVYKPAKDNQDALVYNTTATPTKGYFNLTLADGTKVMLDAASSIRYPANFTGDERRVAITGQVYFEVAHDPRKPFRVTAGEQTVEVLGTHFNINAYDDEPDLRTTLLEGSVKVSQGGHQALLKPGQQSLVTPGTNAITVREADLEEAVAWKNGYFMFNDETIGTVMRKMARWYDIEVVYGGPVSKEKFRGTVSRFKNISTVLKMLEYSKAVHFKVEGRRITVTS